MEYKSISPEQVNHPDHYGGEDNPYEVIKILENTLTTEEFIGFCKGNSIKYLLRANKKGREVDYQKSEWYNNRMNSFIKKKQISEFKNKENLTGL